MITKPDLGGFSHPARFPAEVIQVMRWQLVGFRRILDPFAGTGRIHVLGDYGHETWGTEIEPEWAGLHPRTIIGNALYLPFADSTFDGVATSPTYANRLADHHDARDGSVRRSYTHDLGRALHRDNSGAMQWGDSYRRFHEAAEWHRNTLEQTGFVWLLTESIPTRHLKQGENDQRAGPELVMVFTRGAL